MLKVKELRKEFDGIVAVDNVSFEVQRGQIFGLLGPNGAGKTTTIRMILQIIKPDKGLILYDGKPFTPEQWNRFGYLPEERGLYRKSRVIDVILYFAGLKGIRGNEAHKRIFYWLERFGLQQDAHRKVEEFSKGNQQKIQLIIAFLHNPQLIVLDEPFSGLDPINQQLLKDIILELRQKNMAIIFSAHQMEQVEKICDSLLILKKGREVLHGSLTEVKRNFGTNTIRIEYEGHAEFMLSHPLVRKADVYHNYAEVELNDITQSNFFLKDIVDHLKIKRFEMVEPSLHTIFLHVIQSDTEKIEKVSM